MLLRRLPFGVETCDVVGVRELLPAPPAPSAAPQTTNPPLPEASFFSSLPCQPCSQCGFRPCPCLLPATDLGEASVPATSCGTPSDRATSRTPRNAGTRSLPFPSAWPLVPRRFWARRASTATIFMTDTTRNINRTLSRSFGRAFPSPGFHPHIHRSTQNGVGNRVDLDHNLGRNTTKLTSGAPARRQ